jgi:hypothetical protein
VTIANQVLAHTLEEGGDWEQGFHPDWSVLVMEDGRVYSREGQRAIERGTPFVREIFTAERIDNVKKYVEAGT